MALSLAPSGGSLQGPPMGGPRAVRRGLRSDNRTLRPGLRLAGLPGWALWIGVRLASSFAFLLDSGLDFGWISAGFGFGLILLGLDLIPVWFDLDLAWILHFRLLLLGFLLF